MFVVQRSVNKPGVLMLCEPLDADTINSREEQDLPDQGKEELHVQIKRSQVLLKVQHQQMQKYYFFLKLDWYHFPSC